MDRITFCGLGLFSSISSIHGDMTLYTHTHTHTQCYYIFMFVSYMKING